MKEEENKKTSSGLEGDLEKNELMENFRKGLIAAAEKNPEFLNSMKSVYDELTIILLGLKTNLSIMLNVVKLLKIIAIIKISLDFIVCMLSIFNLTNNIFIYLYLGISVICYIYFLFIHKI